MTPVTCARCQQPMKRGQWRYRGLPLRYGKDAQEPVHKSLSRCNAVLDAKYAQEQREALHE